MPKRTYQPSKRRRSRRLGFRAAKKGKRKKVIQKRRSKGRKRLAPTN